MAYQETIKLVSHSNLIMGNCPSGKIALRQVAQKLSKASLSKKDLQSLGFFDSNTANYNTYYPDVTQEDLKPKKSEFIEPLFRALSKVIVHKEWNPVDFSHRNVLRKSTALLKGQTVNVDHEMAVGNAVGSVSAVAWQEEYTTPAGIIIPGGINSRLKIDGKSNPKLARGIMMDPPSIHSTSVTVNFLWEKSHPNMSQDEFFKNLGSYDKDQKLVRRIAILIRRYDELSLVSHGADPFAQKIDENGNLNNPTYAAIEMNSKINPKIKKREKIFHFSFRTDVVSNSKNKTIPIKTNNNSSTKLSMKEIFALIAQIMGLSLNEKKPDHKAFGKSLKKLAASAKDAEEFKAKLAKLEPRVLKLKEAGEKKDKQIARLTKFRDSQIAKLRKEVTRNYKLANAKAVDSKVLKMIERADMVTLEGLNAQYLTSLEKSYPTKCGDCGSSNINRSSALSRESKKTTKFKGTDEELMRDFEQKEQKNAVGIMH